MVGPNPDSLATGEGRFLALDAAPAQYPVLLADLPNLPASVLCRKAFSWWWVVQAIPWHRDAPPAVGSPLRGGIGAHVCTRFAAESKAAGVDERLADTSGSTARV